MPGALYNTTIMIPLLAQNTTIVPASPGVFTILLVTLVLIFITAIVTTIATKWSRDKCLKMFNLYHVTLEGLRGNTDWGCFHVFSSGMEIRYDHAYVDTRGRKKSSTLIYGNEIESRTLSIFRYHDLQTPQMQQARAWQVRKTFNPGLIPRFNRGVRNLLNTLRDAFNTAIGSVIGQYQRLNPTNDIMAQQAGNITQLGQTLLGRAAANAYEPLLEQYIGHPVILDVVDPLNPNNAAQQYGGYLADYTQQFVAVFNVEHGTGRRFEIILPDIEQGDPLPPLPPPPPPGGQPPNLPTPLMVEEGIAIRVDDRRMKIHNTRQNSVVLRILKREGFEPLVVNAIIPPNAVLSMPARDSRGAKIIMESVRMIDIIAPRKHATVRHAGEVLYRPGLLDDLGLDQLPLIPKLLDINRTSSTSSSQRSDESGSTSGH